MKKINKLIIITVISAMALSMLVGCGKKTNNSGKETNNSGKETNTVAMNVGGYDINEDEIKMYAMLQLLSGTFTYEELKQSPDTYKQKVLDSIIKSKMLNEAFKEENKEFTSSDEETRDKLITNFKGYTTDEILTKYGITDDLIQEMFQEYSVMNKMQNDKKNELGQELQTKYEEEYKDYNFQTIYYLAFPTVEEDEDGNPSTDENGNYISVSDEKKAEQKANIEKAVEEINGGKDAKEVAEAYGVDAYSAEQNCYVGGYSDDMNDVMASLEVGKCTDIYESTTGYYSIVLLTTNDKDLLTSFAYSMASNDLDTEYSAWEQEWIDKCEEKGGVVQNNDFWEKFDILEMATYLNEKEKMN